METQHKDKYIIYITNVIEKCLGEIESIPDAQLAWEYTKMIIRRKTIQYSVKRKKYREACQNSLIQEVCTL